MYTPKIFTQQDEQAIAELIASYPLGCLVCHSDTGLEVVHTPFYKISRNGQDYLHGHIARANPLWKNLEGVGEALVIFQGPQGYISPNWYPTKQEHGKAVPTWNYMAVHARGSIECIHDDDWKRAMLTQLTELSEADQAEPWRITDAPEAYIAKQINALVGIEIKVSHWQGKWKLSQNQPEANRQGVLSGLEQANHAGSSALLDAMKNGLLKNSR